MTDNEKRAHDFAIASLPILFKIECDKPHPISGCSFDALNTYASCYSSMLSFLSEECVDKSHEG